MIKNHLMYAVASVLAGEKVEERNPRHQNRTPKWKSRIHKTINTYWKDLALIKEFRKGNLSPNVKNKVMTICNKLTMTLDQLDEVQAITVMKMQAKAQRLRRYDKQSTQYYQNKLFNNYMKKFCRNMKEHQIEIKDPPSLSEIYNFWRQILENDIRQTRNKLDWGRKKSIQSSRGEWMEWFHTWRNNSSHKSNFKLEFPRIG